MRDMLMLALGDAGFTVVQAVDGVHGLEVLESMAMPDVMEKFEQYGAEDGGGSPERFAEFMRNETQKWARVVKEAKVQVDA